MVKLESFRIYCEVYEQGLDFSDYLSELCLKYNIKPPINILYTTKSLTFGKNVIANIIQKKKPDILISVTTEDYEYPFVMVEYSTAVATDDHKMQRFDGTFWSAFYRTPYIKISPLEKRMGQQKQHGGGSKITDDLERYLALCLKSPYYKWIKWPCSLQSEDILRFNTERPSCIPYSEELNGSLDYILNTLLESDSYSIFLETLTSTFNKANIHLKDAYAVDKLKSIFPNTTRFSWIGNSIKVKINRFGHAMDPDRGIVYFMSMLLGPDNVYSEIQIQRATIKGKMSYSSLFNLIPDEKTMLEYAETLIDQGNFVNPETAIDIFCKCTKLNRLFSHYKINQANEVILDDSNFQKYLEEPGGLSHKFIFLFSSELRLTDVNRNIIVTVKWNMDLSKQYFSTLLLDYSKNKIKLIESGDLKNEDLVTYIGVELMKKANISVLATSYPGAQGDRCILVGKGREATREYIDFIGYTKNPDIKLFLQENKSDLSKSEEDVKKLLHIKNDLQNELQVFIKKILNETKIDKVILGLGAKYPKNPPTYDVDYIISVKYDKIINNQIMWCIWLNDLSLTRDFALLKNEDNQLRGTLTIKSIYKIDG